MDIFENIKLIAVETLKDIYKAIKLNPVHDNESPEYYPDSNYESFPEEITGYVNEKKYGLHVSFDALEDEGVSMGHRSCFYGEDKLRHMGFFSNPWEVIERIKGSHGCNVYICEIFASEDDPIVEIEHGEEYRQYGALVNFKRLPIC